MNEYEFVQLLKAHTDQTPQRLVAWYNAVGYMVMNKVEGAIVECGVEKGANIYGAIKLLSFIEDYTRPIYLYDSFDGIVMLKKDYDVDIHDNAALEIIEKIGYKTDVDEVKELLGDLFYGNDIHYKFGSADETQSNPANVPRFIALLRLNTNFYESTKIQLELLWKNVISNGILIIDHYGHWKGCKMAVDEFFKDKQDDIFSLKKIDYTAIQIIKQ